MRFRIATALAVVALLSGAAALAQDPTPSAFPASDLDLMAVVKSLLGSVKAPVLFMLTVLAAGGHRVFDYFGFKKLAVGFLLVVPPLMGMLLGALSAVVNTPPGTGDWISQVRLIQSMLEGSIINGGMAIILGALCSLGLAKIPGWRTVGESAAPS